MRRLGFLPAAGCRCAVIGLGLALMVALPSATSWAQQKPKGMVFGSDAGIVFNTIKPGKTADFEMIMGKLKQALAASKNPQRQQQAASWKVFKSVEPGPNGNTLYLFIMDPVVHGADYTVAKILDEAFPKQIQQLYKTFASCYVRGGQSIVNLKLIDNLGSAGGGL